MLYSLLLWIIDRTTGYISLTLGKMICGDTYLCPVDGVVCDRSCGFNTDMHLALFLVSIFLIGFVLYLSSKKVFF